MIVFTLDKRWAVEKRLNGKLLDTFGPFNYSESEKLQLDLMAQGYYAISILKSEREICQQTKR